MTFSQRLFGAARLAPGRATRTHTVAQYSCRRRATVRRRKLLDTEHGYVRPSRCCDRRNERGRGTRRRSLRELRYSDFKFDLWRGALSKRAARSRRLRSPQRCVQLLARRVAATQSHASRRANQLQREVRGRWHSAAALFLRLRPCRNLGLRRLTELGMQSAMALKDALCRWVAGVRFETRNQDALVLS